MRHAATRYAPITAGALLVLLSLGGCNDPKSPQAVASDTAAAEQKAASSVADAQNDAAKDDAKMQAKVDDKMAALNNTAAQGDYDVALKQAQGARDVALQKCQALGGDAQSKCKDQADADYQAAKASAKAAEVSKTQ